VNNAAGNLEAQEAAFDDAIVRKPDAIFLSAIESPPFEDYIKRAVDSGIPVFDYDHVTNNALIRCSVTHDQVKCGEEAGQWLVDYANATNTHLYVYEIWGAMAQDGAQKRHQGYQNAFRNQPLITVLESPDTGWKSEEAMNAVLDAFPTHPELNAICSQYDMTAGITEALRTMGMLYPVGDPNHIPIVVMDEEPLVMQHIREGLIDGTAAHGPWEEADPLVKAMLLNVCLGENVPSKVLISTYMVTKDNMDSPRWNAPNIWGDMMNKEPDYDKWPILNTSEIGIRTPSVE
jgi:ABC-type sugar transport system substrate-binding protein